MRSPLKLWLSLLALIGCGGGFQDTTINGLTNFAPFSPSVQDIYRVAHPTTTEAWIELQKQVQKPGKQVFFVQLHDDVEGDDAPFAKMLGWDLLKVPLPPEDDRPWTILELPKKADVQRVVDAIWSAHLAGQVVVFGCVHARDRTSLVAAVLGMQKLNWSKEYAENDMTAHGFRWVLPDLWFYFATEVP